MITGAIRPICVDHGCVSQFGQPPAAEPIGDRGAYGHVPPSLRIVTPQLGGIERVAKLLECGRRARVQLMIRGLSKGEGGECDHLMGPWGGVVALVGFQQSDDLVRTVDDFASVHFVHREVAICDVSDV